MEFAHVVAREDFRRNLSGEMRRRFRLDRWQDAQVRQVYLRALLGDFERLLGQFEWSEVFVTTDVRIAAVSYMAQYALGSQDAIHLACAMQKGVLDLASLDEKYRVVDGIYLWNDLIHATR